MTARILEALTLCLGLHPGARDWLRAKWRTLTRARLHSNEGNAGAAQPAELAGTGPARSAMSTAINTDFKELRLALDLLREWRQAFPAMAEGLPLYGNAVNDLRNAHPVDPPRVIFLALTLYRCDPTHIQNSVWHKVRYYLNGFPATPADASTRRRAKNALRKLERARAARKAHD